MREFNEAQLAATDDPEGARWGLYGHHDRDLVDRDKPNAGRTAVGRDWSYRKTAQTSRYTRSPNRW
jgi:hypothetical protein